MTFLPDVMLQSESSHLQTYTELLEELESLQGELLKSEADFSQALNEVNIDHLPSALNLLHYLGLRRHDLRPLQKKLSALGLSSLGRSEAHVLKTLYSITSLLRRALGLAVQEFPNSLVFHSSAGLNQLQRNVNNLFGKAATNREVRIMVTLPSEAASDYSLVKNLLQNGMDCARINCAHDEPIIWEGMINQIRKAERETRRHCRIHMDLSGPKLRTGDIIAGPPVVKWKPKRDAYGNVVSPAQIWLYPEDQEIACPENAEATLPISGDWLSQASVGDTMEFVDARGAGRSLKLVNQVGNGFWAEAHQTSYVTTGLELHLVRVSSSGHPSRMGRSGHVGVLPHSNGPIILHRGDMLILTRDDVLGRPAEIDKNGRLLRAASIGCSLPQVFSCIKPGERVLIDDGRIGGVVRNVTKQEILVEITLARNGGEKLLTDKGINFPDSLIEISGLTKQDFDNLPFIAQHADTVGLSFIRKPDDISILQKKLKELDALNLGIILKVENRQAFECLPDLLFTLMHSSNVGIMIARGDLAVECGYERLAELQEEMLWLAEASHLPVVWATQVLEGLAKNGKPSRAEITDAAMSERAECVMLNKGPYILDAIQTLDSILRRMREHQQKKIPLLRRLHW